MGDVVEKMASRLVNQGQLTQTRHPSIRIEMFRVFNSQLLRERRG
jgi:hypothetical protein